MMLKCDELIQAIIEEGSIWKFLKQHGGVSLFAFIFRYFRSEQGAAVEYIMERYTPISCPRVDTLDELYEAFAKFAGSTLAMILDNSTNRAVYWTDEQKKKFLGLAPPLQYYLGLSPKDRRSIFFKSTDLGSLFAGRVIINDFKEEYQKVHVLAFADGRNYQIDDLGIYMDILTSECQNLSDGSYVNVVYHGAVFHERQILCTTSVEIWPTPTIVKLGVIQEKDLPLCYIFFRERPFNAYWSYLPSLMNRNAYFYENSLLLYNLDYKKIYSYCRKNLRALEASSESRLHRHKIEKDRLVTFHIKEALKLYKEGEIPKSLKILRKTLKIDPMNLATLLNRAAIYGNLDDCKKATNDLLKCLEIDPENKKACAYLQDILISRARKYEEAEYFDAAACCYEKLMRLPAFATNEHIITQHVWCVVRHVFYLNTNPNETLSDAPEWDCQTYVEEDSGIDNTDESYGDAPQNARKLLEEEELRLGSKCPWMDVKLLSEVIDRTTTCNVITLDTTQEEEPLPVDVHKDQCEKFVLSLSENSPKKIRMRHHYRRHMKKKSRKRRRHAHRSRSSSPSSSRRSRRKDRHHSHQRSRSSSRSISSRCKGTVHSRRSQSLSPLRRSKRKGSHHSTSSSISSRNKDTSHHLRHSPSPSTSRRSKRKEWHRASRHHSRSSSKSASSRHKDIRHSPSVSPSRRITRDLGHSPSVSPLRRSKREELRRSASLSPSRQLLHREELHRSRRSPSLSKSVSLRYKAATNVRRTPSTSPSRCLRRPKHRSRSLSSTPPPVPLKRTKPCQPNRQSRSSSSSESPKPKL